MTRWPTCASDGLTAVPTAATMPHGSCPAIVGALGAASPPVSPPAFGRRYWCRSLPHMPDAFISMTTHLWARRRYVGEQQSHYYDTEQTKTDRAHGSSP